MNVKTIQQDILELLRASKVMYWITGGLTAIFLILLCIPISAPILALVYVLFMSVIGVHTIVAISYLSLVNSVFGARYAYKNIFLNKNHGEYLTKFTACFISTIIAGLTQILLIGCAVLVGMYRFDVSAEISEVISYISPYIDLKTVIIIVFSTIISCIANWFVIFLSAGIASVAKKWFFGLIAYIGISSLFVTPITNLVIKPEIVYGFFNLLQVGNISSAVSLMYIPYIGLQILFSIVFYIATINLFKFNK